MLNGHSVTPEARDIGCVIVTRAFVTNHTSTHGNQGHYSVHPQTFVDSYIAILVPVPFELCTHTETQSVPVSVHHPDEMMFCFLCKN